MMHLSRVIFTIVCSVIILSIISNTVPRSVQSTALPATKNKSPKEFTLVAENAKINIAPNERVEV